MLVYVVKLIWGQLIKSVELKGDLKFLWRVTTTCFRSVANQMKTASVKREALNMLFSRKWHIIKK